MTTHTNEQGDAARAMLTAADQLDELHRQLRTNPVDFELGYQLVCALLPDGFYHLAETQLADAFGVECFQGDWHTADYRVLCNHILKEGD